MYKVILQINNAFKLVNVSKKNSWDLNRSQQIVPQTVIKTQVDLQDLKKKNFSDYIISIQLKTPGTQNTIFFSQKKNNACQTSSLTQIYQKVLHYIIMFVCFLCCWCYFVAGALLLVVKVLAYLVGHIHISLYATDLPTPQITKAKLISLTNLSLADTQIAKYMLMSPYPQNVKQ